MENCLTTSIPFRPVPLRSQARRFNNCIASSATNISSIIGKKIKGKVVYWRTISGNHFVDHIGATAINNDLLVIWKSGQNGSWQVVNVTQKTGKKSASNLTAWQTKNGQYNVEHLAARSMDGSLLVFIWSSRHDWQAIDVSAKTNKKIAGDPVSWQSRNGQYNVEHLAGRGTDKSLLVFWWSPIYDWQSINVSSKTGKKINGNAVSWQTREVNQNIEHLAARGTDGDLLSFWWTPSDDWQVVSISSITGKKIAGNITAWQTKSGDYNVEHLAAQGEDGALLIFWRSPLHDWQVIDATFITGQKIEGSPDNYQIKEGSKTVELLTARNPSNELILFWWKSDLDWQMINLTRITNNSVVSDPASWTILTKLKVIQYIAAEGPNNNLLLFTLKDKERLMTDEIHRPVESFSRKRNLKRKVVAIIWDPHIPEVERPTKSMVDAMLFGPVNSVRHYFLENSNGYFTIDKADIVGWFDADYPPREYWHDPPDDLPGRDSGREAIIKASAVFDFNYFDKNNNNELQKEELGVLFIIPRKGIGGLNRIVGEDYTTRDTASGISINGLLIKWIAEVSIGTTFNPDNIGIVAHELSHLLLGHGDMYFRFPNSVAAGPYDLMDQHRTAPHIDPFAKLKFGWLRPEIIFASGIYYLDNIEKSHKIYILMHPVKGADEYFIIENRFKNTNYDLHIPYNGLAIWHITEKKEVYKNSTPPRNVTAKEWKTIDGFCRKGIRLIKPHLVRNTDNRKLWDGAFPERSYPLRSINRNQNRSTLVWSDGSPSGFTIKNFSPAGETMSFQVIVPF